MQVDRQILKMVGQVDRQLESQIDEQLERYINRSNPDIRWEALLLEIKKNYLAVSGILSGGFKSNVKSSGIRCSTQGHCCLFLKLFITRQARLFSTTKFNKR